MVWGFKFSKEFIDSVHSALYDGQNRNAAAVAEYLGTNKQVVRGIIERGRKRNPDRWPIRNHIKAVMVSKHAPDLEKIRLSVWAGASSTQLAGELGVSRNVIIGIVNRERAKNPEQWPPKQSPRRHFIKKETLKAQYDKRTYIRGNPLDQKKVKVVKYERKESEPASLKIAFGTADADQCKWIGDPKDGYCGHATLEKSSYCEFHHGVVWTPHAAYKPQWKTRRDHNDGR